MFFWQCNPLIKFFWEYSKYLHIVASIALQKIVRTLKNQNPLQLIVLTWADSWYLFAEHSGAEMLKAVGITDILRQPF